MIVDAHQHFWRLDRGDYGWLQPGHVALYRDHLPEHFAQLAADHQVRATVLVQAAATEAETRYLLDLATRDPLIAGVVGWIDMEAPDAPRRIAALVADGHGRLKGIRPMVQDIADPQWLRSPALDRAFEALIAHGLVFDALVEPRHLAALHERLQRHRGLRAVLDHAGKPDIAGKNFAGWAEDVTRLAGHAALYCKLSGLLTQAADNADVDDLAPFVGHLFEHFGADRMVWGSDWPVLNLRADYGRWLEMARRLASAYAPGHEDAVFANNAIALYGLDIEEGTT